MAIYFRETLGGKAHSKGQHKRRIQHETDDVGHPKEDVIPLAIQTTRRLGLKRHRKVSTISAPKTMMLMTSLSVSVCAGRVGRKYKASSNNSVWA